MPSLSSPAFPQSTLFARRFEYSPLSLMREIAQWSRYSVAMLPLQAAGMPSQQSIVTAAPAIVGIASLYDPGDQDNQESGTSETASGERYDANDWTAAIRTDLREQFGGVGFGKNYRTSFALVQSGDKQVIVRINDVGELKPGRIIDLNQRAMRYFDPALQRGLLGGVRVTPLRGQDWAVGPVLDDLPMTVAGRFDR